MGITAAVASVPVGEYLGSVYHPDKDFVEGVLEKRHLCEIDHADLQYALLMAFSPLWKQHGIRARPELRVQIGPARYRVPDICVLPSGWERTRIVKTTPLLCIEVLSPRDTVQSTKRRAEDYISIGVAEVWIFDPQTRTVYVLSKAGLMEQRSGKLQLQNTPVQVDIDSIFSTLDD